MGEPCPKGHYCEQGIVSPKPCGTGKYSDTTGASVCKKCPPKFTCPNTTNIDPVPCSPGHYCSGGEGTEKGQPCPTGTYLPSSSAGYRNECLACPPGRYCDMQGQSNYAGSCLAGYLCRGGAKFQAPNDTSNPYNGPCPVGLYCEAGTTNGTKCPAGTMRPYPGGKTLSDCQPCTGGYYCDQDGLSSPKGKCLQGYYCPSEAKITVPTPSTYQCPKGYYCGNGTAHPRSCPPGKYQPSQVEYTCLNCPAGKYCAANTSVPVPCPAHHYCVEGTIAPEFCPNGTFTKSDVTGLSKPNQCNPCINGSFCQRGMIAGLCTAGYLCYTGNPTSTPDGSNKTIGELCPVGHYCPAGALEPLKCPSGLVIVKPGAKSQADCQTCPAGYICVPGSSIPSPCRAGYYCPVNQSEIPCPKQTYSDSIQAADIRTCQPCPAGYWCNDVGEGHWFSCYVWCFLVFLFFCRRCCVCSDLSSHVCF